MKLAVPAARKVPASLAFVAAAALLLGGCAASANDQSSGGDTDSGTQSSATLAFSQGGSTIDPAEAQDPTSDTIVLAAYDQLTDYHVEDGAQVSGEWDPVLAQSWETSADGLTWTFSLREGVTFESGNPLTADDVVYSIQRVADSATGSSLYTLAKISGATAVDDTTVEVTLSEPNPGLLDYISMYTFAVVDSVLVEEQSDPDEWLKTNTAGSGPYSVTSWDPATEAKLVARDDFWGDAPAISNYTFKFVPEMATQIQQLERGDIDLVTGIPVQNIDQLAANDDLVVAEEPAGLVYYFAMNNDVAPFDDPLVRQAISYAIPYSDVVQTALMGHGSELKAPISPITPYYDESTDPYSYDPAKARELLAQAGFPDGLEFTALTQSSTEPAMVIMQEALAEIGVTMNLQTLAAQQFSAAKAEGQEAAFVDAWISFINQPGYHLGFLLRCDGSANHAHYCNPEVDALIDQASLATDEDQAQQLWSQVQTLIAADAPWAYLYSANSTAAMQSDLTGYASYVDQMVRPRALAFE